MNRRWCSEIGKILLNRAEKFFSERVAFKVEKFFCLWYDNVQIKKVMNKAVRFGERQSESATVRGRCE